MHRQRLTFSLRIARSREELLDACRVRAISYGHHLPHLREALLEPDALDFADNTVNVLCVDKKTGSPVGTARFQTNEGGPLLIESSATIPLHMQADTRAEITRLSAVAGADRLVKVSLMKASFLFCVASQVRWMVIGARSEALERQYRRIGFHNLLEGYKTVPLVHAGGIEHMIMAFNVSATERTWRASQHPLYEFFFDTFHPDIQMFPSEFGGLQGAANAAVHGSLAKVPASSRNCTGEIDVSSAFQTSQASLVR